MITISHVKPWNDMNGAAQYQFVAKAKSPETIQRSGAWQMVPEVPACEMFCAKQAVIGMITREIISTETSLPPPLDPPRKAAP